MKIQATILIFAAMFFVTFFFSLKFVYEKGFNAGIEWERNIILEYGVQCDEVCQLT